VDNVFHKVPQDVVVRRKLPHKILGFKDAGTVLAVV
jgi:hypothetical protein